MKIAIISFVVLMCLLTSCNSVGPYTVAVYRLEDSVHMVNVNTWVGRGRGWPNGNEKLKRDAEVAVFDVLKGRGLRIESCVFAGFTSFEGGHIGLTFIAGGKSRVAPWAAMSGESFDLELKRRGPLPVVFKSSGEFKP